jgi:hypothetical protein
MPDTTAELAAFDGVASGETVVAEWADLPAGERGWYVAVTDPYGAEALSAVQVVTVEGGPGNGNAPPHAGEQGRPDHAGKQSSPAHAGGKGDRP